MKKLGIVAGICFALFGGCRRQVVVQMLDQQPRKMGAVSGPMFRIIPSGYDPSVSGLTAAKGDIVQSSGTSGQAWQKSGPNATDWVVTPPVGGGSIPDGGVAVSVADGGGLAGNGTTAIPLTGIVATPSAAGLMSAAQFMALNAFAAYPITFDWTTTGDKGVIPGLSARAGAGFIPSRYVTTVVTETGTASGTVPAFNLGWTSGSQFNDILLNSGPLTLANINAGVGTSTNTNVLGVASVHNQDMHVYVPTAVTGATVLTVTITFFGTWVSF